MLTTTTMMMMVMMMMNVINQKITIVSRIAEKALIDHQAYIKAMTVKNNLDIRKFRKEIMEERKEKHRNVSVQNVSVKLAMMVRSNC